MAGKIHYAYLDESPVIFDDDKAVQFVAGRWKPLHLADAACKARLLSEEEFRRVYPALPAAPIP